MVHTHDHWHRFDDPERQTVYYSPDYLICYVTHNSKWLNHRSGNRNQAFLELLKSKDLDYGLDSGFEPLRFSLSVEDDDDTPHFTLFRIAVGKNTVEEVYENIVTRIQNTGESCALPPDDDNDNPVTLNRIALPDDRGNEAYLEHVMLEWYAAGSPHTGLGSHGPGGKPRKVEKQDVGKWKFEFSEDLAAYNSYRDNPCANVEVYILDTIPPKCRIKQALSNWSALRPYEKILAPYGVDYNPYIYETENALYIYAAALGQDFSQTNVLHDYSHPIFLNDPDRQHFEREHQYDFSDHGLFIAGIVHSIAPHAHLNVIQVMNDYGIGTFWNFAAGFQEVARRHRKYHAHKHAIINCSFTLSVPIGLHDKTYLPERLAKFENRNRQFKAQLNAVVGALNACVTPNTRIVAAAGNDSNRNMRKDARYPANAKHVIGVGALGSTGGYAHYSNKPDNPVSDGLLTFGGEYDDPTLPANAVNPPDQGIVGIFTGNLNILLTPNDPNFDTNLFDNPYGLAEWEGTSFASPIVAGTLALLCCAGCETPAQARDDVEAKIPVEVDNNRIKKFDKIKQKRDHE